MYGEIIGFWILVRNNDPDCVKVMNDSESRVDTEDVSFIGILRL